MTTAHSLTLNAAPSQDGSFLEMYSNPTVTANDRAGTGFRDGTLILEGTADAFGNEGSK